MSEPTPINVAAIEARSTQAEAKELAAEQVLSNARFEEEVETASNPAASERESARLSKFRPMTARGKVPEGERKLIQEVDRRTEDDLARDFSKRNDELPPDRLRELRRQLTAHSSADEVIDQVTRFFKDPLLADEAMEFLELTADSEDLLENIRLARGILFEKNRSSILAGRNVNSVAKFFHKKGIGEDPSELRELYSNITTNPKSHNALFSELSAKYPFDQLQTVVAFLLKGLGYDLKSKGPSIPSAELMLLMTELRNLQSIVWIFMFFKSRKRLMRMMYEQYGEKPSKMLSFETMAKEFIKLVEDKYPTVVKLLKDSEKLGVNEVGQIVILTQFRDAIRNLSPRVFSSQKQRQNLLLVIMETLEEIESEDEEETGA